MVRRRVAALALLGSTVTGTWANAQDIRVGSVRGQVDDADFEVPLPNAQVKIVETGAEAQTSSLGNYVFPQVEPGTYTLIFRKDGYLQQVRSGVAVQAGRLTEVSVALAGDFVEMEEMVVQDSLRLDTGSEEGLLQLRFESPALLDSISAERMSLSGASDAADAVGLVAGATVKDGKSAVIRGLPDRYVSTQMNGVRLPSADADKRAVELDQFPSTVIESVQISKTFTPDQQGDASGGAVDVRLRGVPDGFVLQWKGQIGGNSQVTGRRDFLSYTGGGIDRDGRGLSRREPQLDRLGRSWDGAVGTKTQQAPIDYKLNGGIGGSYELAEGWKIGGFANIFYERDSSFYDNGIDDSYWVLQPGEPLTPETIQGTPQDGEFKTALFDVTRGTQSLQTGGLFTAGIESEDHSLNLTYLSSRTTEDEATLAFDRRGKENYFPGYDPDDPEAEGNEKDNRGAAPYLRLETLEYTERTTDTLQLHGHHRIPLEGFGFEDLFVFRRPEFDWILADSSATIDQPDKRQFGALWLGESLNPGAPPFIDPFIDPALWLPFKPSANFTLGNLQRIWKKIEEESEQWSGGLKLPFTQWNGVEGYFQFGAFQDKVDREFDQNTFSNFGDNSTYEGDFDDPWSSQFPFEDHPITESEFDVDYVGEQDIDARYAMLSLPFVPFLDVTGGVRMETTEIGIINIPEELALWYPEEALAPVQLNPGDADVNFLNRHVLRSLGFSLRPVSSVNLRGAWAETVARQTFKELTPILQQEFLGGPIFIGNPDLRMSELVNYDLRLDYTPLEGSFFSTSWFRKDLTDPIEYVQRFTGFTFTTARNYPRGRIKGWEYEFRQELGSLWEPLEGFSLGANATYMRSRVKLPNDEVEEFLDPGVAVSLHARDMLNAPERLLNFFAGYKIKRTGTEISMSYNIQGDTLVAGAGIATFNFVPNVYAKEFETLNLTLRQQVGPYVKLQAQLKNLTNPRIEQVYRADHLGGDVTKSSFTKGIDYSLGLSAEFRF